MEPCIVGVDVGNGLTKTVNSLFTSSVKCYGETKPSIMEKTIFFEGSYYSVGGKRSKTKTDQKEDNTALILTLAGLGEEFKIRHINPSNLILSEGLPLERCIEINQRFDEKYYKQGKTINFEYEDIPYRINIQKVFVNPQGVAGIIDKIQDIPETCVVIDLGSWTMDVLLVIEGKPIIAESKSLLSGLIPCMLRCNEEIRRRTGKEVMEEQIQKIMQGKTGVLPPKYEDLIVENIKIYIRELYDVLNENGYNVDTLPCVFLGGGSIVVKNFGGENIFPMSTYYTDIHLNAKGYEKIAAMKLRRK